MMKRFMSLVLLLCLFSCTALAADGDLPDIEAFSNGLLEIDPDKTKEKPFLICKEYTGTKEDVLFIATEYVTLLEKYGMEEICHFKRPFGISLQECWAFRYTNDVPQMSTFSALLLSSSFEDSTKTEGQIKGLQVYIDCYRRPDDRVSSIEIQYAPECNYIDTGDRIDLSKRPTVAPTATPTVAPTAAPTATPEKCPICNGTGKCPKCGGDMWVTGYVWEYVNGSPVSVLKTKLCHGQYCYGGACDKCGGDGWLDDK